MANIGCSHRHLLLRLLSPRTATLDLTANIVCSECFRFRCVTNVNHCIVPNALIVPRSKSMLSRPHNGKNVRRKHSLQPIAAPLCAVRYCVNYNVSSLYSTCLWLITLLTRNRVGWGKAPLWGQSACPPIQYRIRFYLFIY